MQAARPEVSSALAAVVDRATAKDLDDRYATRRRLDRRPRGRAGDRDGAQRAHHRRGDDGLPVAARAEAPPRARRRAAPGALAPGHRRSSPSRSSPRSRCSPAAPSAGPGRRARSRRPTLKAVSLGQSRAKDYDPARRPAGAPGDRGARARPRPGDRLGHRDLPHRQPRARTASASRSTPSPASPRGSSSCARRTPGWSGEIYARRHARALPDDARRPGVDAGRHDPPRRRASRASTSTPAASASATT